MSTNPASSAANALRASASDLAGGVLRQGLKRPMPKAGRLLSALTGGGLSGAVAGRTVLVTGASSGIGEATAHRLARAGARVQLVARREAELERVAIEIRAAGGEADWLVCDLSDRAAIEALVARLLAEDRAPEIVINNAGRSIRRSITDSFDRFHDFERTMAINYYGPVALTLGLLPTMLEAGYGQFVNISTWGTQLPSPQYVAYAASKSALDTFTRGTAAELLGTGVTLTTVHMPLVRTPMIAPALEAYRGMPSLSSDEAAGLIGEAIITRRPRIEPALVTIGHVGDALTSTLTDRIIGTMRSAGIGPVSAKR